MKEQNPEAFRQIDQEQLQTKKYLEFVEKLKAFPRKRFFLITGTAIAVFLLVGATISLAYQNRQLKQQLQVIQPSPTPSPPLAKSTPISTPKPGSTPTAAIFKKELGLGEEVKLTHGQSVKISHTPLSIKLIKIIPAPKDSHDFPTKAYLEVKNGQDSQEISFISGVIATEEVEEKLHSQDVFGFRITREMLNAEAIIISVVQL